MVKTRAGFACVTDPALILTRYYAKGPYWYIYARIKCGPEFETKSLFGRKFSLSAPSLSLAFFNDGPDVQKAIGNCMAHIEEAIRTKAALCDLSQFGDEEPWKKATWNPIQWPAGQP